MRDNYYNFDRGKDLSSNGRKDTPLDQKKRDVII